MRRRAGRRTGPVLAIYLRGEPYHRVVVEVSDPENLSRDINNAIGTSLRPRVAATNLLIGNTRAPRRGSPSSASSTPRLRNQNARPQSVTAARCRSVHRP